METLQNAPNEIIILNNHKIPKCEIINFFGISLDMRFLGQIITKFSLEHALLLFLKVLRNKGLCKFQVKIYSSRTCLLRCSQIPIYQLHPLIESCVFATWISSSFHKGSEIYIEFLSVYKFAILLSSIESASLDAHRCQNLISEFRICIFEINFV